MRTYVYGYEIDHNWPAPHKDVLEQFIHYDVPEDAGTLDLSARTSLLGPENFSPVLAAFD